jgi:hypothetical protein
MPNKNKRMKRKKAVVKEMAPKKKVARKNAASKKSSLARKKTSPKRKRVPSKRQGVETVALRSWGPRERRGGQSGDLQGLSSRPTADSESVEELAEEGNALEAEVLEGVENSPDPEHGQVRTQEVPEDDVPQEYLDRDR